MWVIQIKESYTDSGEKRKRALWRRWSSKENRYSSKRLAELALVANFPQTKDLGQVRVREVEDN